MSRDKLLAEPKCGSCRDFCPNGTRYGGVCEGEGSEWQGLIISCLKGGCPKHNALASDQP